MARTKSAEHVRVIEETSAYWRVVFDYPPFNIVDATIFEGLQDLLARMDSSPSLRVVVFESANPDFYLAHFDLTGKTGNITTAVGPSGLPILMDTLLSQRFSPAPARRRLQPSQPVPPSVAPALALGPDRNPARTSVQTRRSRPPNRPLYPIPSGYRLA